MEKYLTESEKKIRKRWRLFFIINLSIFGLVFFVLPLFGMIFSSKMREDMMVFVAALLFFYAVVAGWSTILYLCSYKGFGTKLLAFILITEPLFDFYMLLKFLITLSIDPRLSSMQHQENFVLMIMGIGLLIMAPFYTYFFFWYRQCYRLRKVNLRVRKLWQTEIAKKHLDLFQECFSLDRLKNLYYLAIQDEPQAAKVLSESFKMRQKFLQKVVEGNKSEIEIAKQEWEKILSSKNENFLEEDYSWLEIHAKEFAKRVSLPS